MIERKEYLQQLNDLKEKGIIKVITGIRRSGKTTLLQLFIQKLLDSGIEDFQIIYTNFEDMEYEELLDYKKLYAYIKSKSVENKTMYLFLDEVQNVPFYEKVVDSLFVKANYDIYITGSNSYIFSSQLATNLRGRYIEIAMLPLSFKEYYSLYGGDQVKLFQQYMTYGGFPYIHQLDMKEDQIHMYMEGIYNTVLLKDIEERLNRKQLDSSIAKTTDVTLLKSLSKYLSSVIGSPISIKGITNYYKSNERKISPNTISSYLQALCESYLFYPVEAMDIVGKELLQSNKKYYIVDTGIRNLILPRTEYDLGFTIENIVYFELLRRGYIVNIGRFKTKEVDFIAKKQNEYTYYQVSATISDKETFDREIHSFLRIEDNYEKIILTLDTLATGNYNGIKVVNVIDWLLE